MTTPDFRANALRCVRCFRPGQYCFCEAIPTIDNLTHVLILQHVGERHHRFNTARIVQLALQRCERIVDHNRGFANRSLPILSGTAGRVGRAGLLFPAEGATELSDLPATARPEQLVIIDGTWHQAKTIVRDTPQLQQLPCYRLSPTSPGQYRIRREPTAHSLSTLEATVSALRALGEESSGLDQLIAAFHQMVDSQVEHPRLAQHRFRRQRRAAPQRNLPRALLEGDCPLVVAYGESTPAIRDRSRVEAPLPVTWLAHRVTTGERFSSVLQAAEGLAPEQREHFRLQAEDLHGAESIRSFRSRWEQFLLPQDVLITYHARTLEMLGNANAVRPKSLVLKAYFRRQYGQAKFRSLEELMQLEGLDSRDAMGRTRGEQRLEMACQLVQQLRSR